MSKRYLMENAEESARLEQKTGLLDIRRLLLMTGFSVGAVGLDAGGGTGAVARVMAGIAGKGARPLVLDYSHERLSYGVRLARSRAGFIRGDLYAVPLKDRAVDYVWSKFVFEYLARPEAALAELHRVTRVGGRVAVVDIDGNGQFHDSMSESLRARLQRVTAALGKHFDPFVGRKLYRMFRDVGFVDIRVNAVPYHLYAGSAPPEAVDNWRIKLETLRPIIEKTLGSARQYRKFSSDFRGHLASPDSLTYSVVFIVDGRREEA